MALVDGNSTPLPNPDSSPLQGTGPIKSGEQLKQTETTHDTTVAAEIGPNVLKTETGKRSSLRDSTSIANFSLTQKEATFPEGVADKRASECHDSQKTGQKTDIPASEKSLKELQLKKDELQRKIDQFEQKLDTLMKSPVKDPRMDRKQQFLEKSLENSKKELEVVSEEYSALLDKEVEEAEHELAELEKESQKSEPEKREQASVKDLPRKSINLTDHTPEYKELNEAKAKFEQERLNAPTVKAEDTHSDDIDDNAEMEAYNQAKAQFEQEEQLTNDANKDFSATEEEKYAKKTADTPNLTETVSQKKASAPADKVEVGKPAQTSVAEGFIEVVNECSEGISNWFSSMFGSSETKVESQIKEKLGSLQDKFKELESSTSEAEDHQKGEEIKRDSIAFTDSFFNFIGRFTGEDKPVQTISEGEKEESKGVEEKSDTETEYEKLLAAHKEQKALKKQERKALEEGSASETSGSVVEDAKKADTTPTREPNFSEAKFARQQRTKPAAPFITRKADRTESPKTHQEAVFAQDATSQTEYDNAKAEYDKMIEEAEYEKTKAEYDKMFEDLVLTEGKAKGADKPKPLPKHKGPELRIRTSEPSLDAGTVKPESTKPATTRENNYFDFDDDTEIKGEADIDAARGELAGKEWAKKSLLQSSLQTISDFPGNVANYVDTVIQNRAAKQAAKAEGKEKLTVSQWIKKTDDNMRAAIDNRGKINRATKELADLENEFDVLARELAKMIIDNEKVLDNNRKVFDQDPDFSTEYKELVLANLQKYNLDQKQAKLNEKQAKLEAILTKEIEIEELKGKKSYEWRGELKNLNETSDPGELAKRLRNLEMRMASGDNKNNKYLAELIVIYKGMQSIPQE